MEILPNRYYRNQMGEVRHVTEIKQLDFVGDHELYVKYEVTHRHILNLPPSPSFTGTMLLSSFRKWAKKELPTEQKLPADA